MLFQQHTGACIMVLHVLNLKKVGDSIEINMLRIKSGEYLKCNKISF